MATKFKVKKDIIEWVVQQTDTPSSELKKEFKQLDEWITKDSEISIAQVEKLSRKTKIPFGYFFMSSIPKESNRLASFRTIENIELNKMSRNLTDIIKNMEAKQSWMREYLIDLGIAELNFVGSYSTESDVQSIVYSLYQTLNLYPGWNEKHPTSYETFRFLRSVLSKAGILVMQSSYVGNSTSRNLELNEFRAFVLIDKYAPLIFLNSGDTYTARLFSLVHELVHIWLGKEEIYNVNDKFNHKHEQYNNLELERFCNKITAEFLLPQTLITENNNADFDVFELAKKFNVSPYFTAIRLKEVGIINQKELSELLFEVNKQYEVLEKENKLIKSNKKTIVPFYTLHKSRYDVRFLRAVKSAVDTGFSSYTEAYTLAGAKGKTFNKLMEGI